MANKFGVTFRHGLYKIDSVFMGELFDMAPTSEVIEEKNHSAKWIIRGNMENYGPLSPADEPTEQARQQNNTLIGLINEVFPEWEIVVRMIDNSESSSGCITWWVDLRWAHQRGGNGNSVGRLVYFSENEKWYWYNEKGNQLDVTDNVGNDEEDFAGLPFDKTE